MRFAVILLTFVYATSSRADVVLPSPLSARDTAALARSRRSELIAAKARARAAAERPTMVSALDDPTISVSLDHVPFNMMGLDASVTVEQTFPLSSVRGNRKRAAQAGTRRELANAQRVGLDVELDAVQAFWMLAQLRASAEISTRRHVLAKQLEAAALARYSSNTGTQSDVLRAQIETVRIAAEQRALAAEVRGAEVMLNTSMRATHPRPFPSSTSAFLMWSHPRALSWRVRHRRGPSSVQAGQRSNRQRPRCAS